LLRFGEVQQIGYEAVDSVYFIGEAIDQFNIGKLIPVHLPVSDDLDPCF
jgi:hypothetical protein